MIRINLRKNMELLATKEANFYVVTKLKIRFIFWFFQKIIQVICTFFFYRFLIEMKKTLLMDKDRLEIKG